jgi:hypothetical protein
MSKKIDWSVFYKNPITRNLSGNSGSTTKYSSGRELMTKSFETAKKQEEIMEFTKQLMPVMSKLFEIRASNGTALKVMRPLHYTASVLIKSETNASFQDTIFTVHPGDELLLKSLDPNLQVFIFTKSNGEEIEIAYAEQIKLLTQTDIYEVCASLYNENKE